MKTQYNYTNLIPDLEQHILKAKELHEVINTGISTVHPFFTHLETLTEQEIERLRELSCEARNIFNPLNTLEQTFEVVDDMLSLAMDNNEENIISAASIIKGEAFDIINHFLKNIVHNAVYRDAANYFEKHPIKYFENNLLVVKNTHPCFDFNFQVLKDLVSEIEKGLLAKLFDQDEEYFRKKFLVEKKEIILQKLADYEEESEVDNEERAEWDRADMLMREQRERDN